MRAWIASDETGLVFLYRNKPYKDNAMGMWRPSNGLTVFSVSSFDQPEGVNPQWSDDEPIEVELKIEKI